MSSHKASEVASLITLEPEELTRGQLLKVLRHIGRRGSWRGASEEDLEKALKENDDVVNLHEEKKGDSKPPKVKEDDLPIAENDLDPPPEEDDEEMIAKKSNKKRLNGKARADG
jgi:hypothetical protein